MKEAEIVRDIMKKLNNMPGCWFIKTHGDAFSRVGVPDLIGMVSGIFVALEVKRPEVGRVSPAQALCLADIRKRGGVAEVVTSAGEAMGVISAAFAKRCEGCGEEADAGAYEISSDL